MVVDTEFEIDQQDIGQADNHNRLLLPEQEQSLELVSHLAAYSDMLVLVTGPDGSGKTLLANTLAEQLSAADESMLVTADMMLGIPALLGQIAAHWQIPLSGEPATARDQIRQEALDRAEQGGSLTVVIDQADQLDADTLNDIAYLALLAPQALTFVLFGLSGFEKALRTGPMHAPVHVQPLQSLSKESAQQLLQRVYSPGQALPLSQNELTFIWQESQGWPGPLLMQAGDYFLAAQPADAPASVSRKESNGSAGRFPLTHILAVTALIAALGLSLLYRSDDATDTEVTPPVAEPVDFLRSSAPVSAVATESDNGDMSVSEESQDIPVADVSQADETLPSASAPEQPPVPSEPDYNYGPAAVAESTVNAPVVAVANQPAPAPVSQPTEAAKPAAAAPKAPATAPAKPVAATDDRQRLLAMQSGFVVQLFGSHDAANADKFRRQWRDDIIGTLYLYETRHNNKPWFVVVSGVYGSRSEAQAAVNALPRSLRSQSPWIRDITAVQKVLR